jgi:hypothetical protein
MLTSDGVFVVLLDGQFEHAPQPVVRRFVIDCHIRRIKNAAAAKTIKMTKKSCITN